MNLRNIKRQWLLTKYGPEYDGTKMWVDNYGSARHITGVFLQSNNVLYVEDHDADGYRIIGLEDGVPIRFEINALCRNIYCKGNMTIVGDVDKAVSCGNLVVDGCLNKYNSLGQEKEEIDLKVQTYPEVHKKQLDEQKKMGIIPDTSKKFQVIEIDGDLDYLLIDNVPNVPIIVDIKTPLDYGVCEHIREVICEGDLFIRGEVIKGVAGKNIFAHILSYKMDCDVKDIIQNFLVSYCKEMSRISEEIVQLCYGTFSDEYLDNDTEYTKRYKRVKKYDDKYDWEKIKRKLTKYQRY